MQLGIKLRNSTLLLPLFPDPVTPGDVPQGVLLAGSGGSADGVFVRLANSGASVSSTHDTTTSFGDRHFPGATTHSHCPTPRAGTLTTLRFAELDVDLRSSDPDFDLCLTLSPVNVTVPCCQKLQSNSASDLAGFKGSYLPPSEDNNDGLDTPWMAPDRSESQLGLQLLASQLQLHSLAARYGLAPLSLCRARCRACAVFHVCVRALLMFLPAVQ